jgi:O-acetyl-ADP-ribose deacetylase (regulator of RNase III)
MSTDDDARETEIAERLRSVKECETQVGIGDGIDWEIHRRNSE